MVSRFIACHAASHVADEKPHPESVYQITVCQVAIHYPLKPVEQGFVFSASGNLFHMPPVLIRVLRCRLHTDLPTIKFHRAVPA